MDDDGFPRIHHLGQVGSGVVDCLISIVEALRQQHRLRIISFIT